jgi:CubicO group peptidase (beta-lactamase class C family)
MADLTPGQGPTSLEGFAEFVETVRTAWCVPGLALAIVKDGAVILAQGFGHRDVEHNLPVGTDTLFAIGSCSKAFTTTALAMLADQGKLDWDAPVRTYLPSFQLHDQFATERMTARDLVTHRSGLPRHDAMWYGAPFTRKELVDRLRYLQPNKDFRTLWQYQNLMYLTAGYLVEVISGISWEEFVAQRIFAPLAMKRTNTSVEISRVDPDAALPYKEENGQVELLPFRNLDRMGPAGSINAPIGELAQWVLLQLNKGKRGERQLVSEGQLAQLHSPQMVMPDAGKYGEMSHPSYAMGWCVQPYRGRNFLHHTGGIDGFSALVTLMPGENLGVAVLTNLNNCPAHMAICLNAYDRLLGLDQVDWHGRAQKDRTAIKEAMAGSKEKSAADARPGTQPSHPLSDYAGQFSHPGYGILTVGTDGDGLSVLYNDTRYALTHYHYDIFEMANQLMEIRTKVSFQTNVQGDIDALAASLESAVSPIVFTRLPARELSDRAVLETFTGSYEVMGMTLSIAFKGDSALLISLPGQPELELTPYKGTTFHVKGLSGYEIEFKRQPDGTVTEAVITQPGAVLTAKRR